MACASKEGLIVNHEVNMCGNKEILHMSNSTHYYRENYEDPSDQYGGAWVALSRSMTDMRFHDELARLDPPKFARALMPEDMRDWLAANVLPSDYSLHVKQQRQEDFFYAAEP